MHPILATIFIVVMMLTHHGVVGKTNNTIKLGYFDPKGSDKSGVLLLSQGMNMGLAAAFARANREGGVDGKPVELVTLDTDFAEYSYAGYTKQLITEHPDTVALLGIMGNNHINLMKPVLDEQHLAHLGPIVSDPIARGFDKETVYIRPDPWAEIVALTEQVISKFRIKRIAFMYTKGYNVPYAPYGETHRKVFYTLMNELGFDVVAEYVYDWNIKTNDNVTTFDPIAETTKFLANRPEAVVMFPGSDDSAAEFMVYCLAHPLANQLAPNLKFFVTEALAILAQLSFVEAKKLFPEQLKDLTPKDRVYSTFTFPLTTDTSYAIVREYHEDMAALYGSAYHKAVGYTTIAGYITGRFGIEVVRRTPKPVTRDGILRTLYAPSMWAVSDLTYGIYKATCTNEADHSHCHCNEGAHLIDIGVLDETYQWQKVPNASYSWDYTQCSGTDIKLRPPTNYLQLFDSSNADEAALAALLRRGKEGAESTSSLKPKVGDIAMRSPGSDAAATVKEVNTSLLVTTIAHSVLGEGAINEADLPWPVIDPFEPKARLALPFREKVLHVHATLQQEFHAFAAHAADLGASELLLVADAADVEAMMVPFEKSATTFRIGSRAIASLDEAGDGSYVVMCGVSNAAGAASVLSALNAKASMRVGVAAAEFHAQYSAFASESDESVRSRLLTATNLPLWGAGGAESSALVKDYHNSIGGAANAHPVSLRSFVSTRALVAVLDYLSGKVTAETVLGTWYDVSIIFADNNVVLGPYFRSACRADGKNAETCECNVGARKLRVFSLQGLLNGTDPAGEKEVTLGSCQIAYTRPVAVSGGLSAGGIAGVAVAVVAIFAIVILGGLKMTQGKQRDTRYAPKDASKPYTLVFTDIQSSTSLWARIPEDMGPALDTHHEIIRKLIKKHRGYEVKTIGDAFMIAFEDVDDAVDLCEALQLSFFEHDWGTKAIDETYKQLEQEALEEDPATDKAISCNLPEALYGKMWNGLRVRCGVHTGMGDIKLDEITQGYDYYGNVPNVAARTEAIGNGGQICVTSFAMNALSKQRSSSDLGPVDLRGVTDPVVINQVDGVPGRKFAGLRVEKGLEADMEYSSTSNTEAMSQSVLSGSTSAGANDIFSQTSGVSGSAVAAHNCNLQEALNTMFSMMDVDTRRSTLKKVGMKWRVQLGRKPADKSSECSELVHAISKRLLGVLSSKQKAAGFGPRSIRVDDRRGTMTMPESTRNAFDKASLSPSNQDLPGAVRTPPSPAKDKYIVT